MDSTKAEQLARFAAEFRFEDLPTRVVHEVKRRVLDSLGCALGAFGAEPCAAARRVAGGFSAARGATILGTRHKAPPDWAAFANGALVRYLDFNDTYLSKEPAHPSDNIPAAIAVAEAEGAGGRELIAAVALAYEVQCRLCDAAGLRARGWDHVTYGAFSSVLAAALLMRLDSNQSAHALGIAGVAAAALRQSRMGELSHWKGCAFANAARHGVFAALLAREGMGGPAPIFEGEAGFERLVSGPLGDLRFELSDLKPDESGAAPLREWMILRTAIKFWPAEHHSQSAIEAALRLRPRFTGVDEVESIRVESHDAAVDIIGTGRERWRPASRETADHSLPYIVAAALADGEITARQFAPERFADSALLALAERVQVVRSSELTQLYPRAVANALTVRLRDGRELRERVDHPRGDPLNPMSDGELEAKFHELSDPVIGWERAHELRKRVWHLEELARVDELLPLAEVRPEALRRAA